MSAPRPHLSRLAAWSLAFGCAVGWGSFVMPGNIFLPKAGPLGTLLGVFAGGLVMAVVAWNYHAMMQRHPGPGGAYAYAKEAFGIDHGFLCAWFLGLTYMAIVWANATALAIVARYTLGNVLTFGFHYTLAGFDVCLGDILVAALVIAAGGAVCCRRRLAGRTQTVAAVGFAVGIFVCFAATASKHEGGLAAMAPAFSPEGASPVWQILRILALSPWLFVGFEGISHASAEFKFPLKRSFGVMAAALLVSVLAYAMLALLPVLLPPEGAADWSDGIGPHMNLGSAVTLPTFAALQRSLGTAGMAIMGVTMFGAIFTGIVGNVFATSRLLVAMADDGVVPGWLGRRNGDGSPRNAVLAVSGVSLLVPFLGRTAIGFIVDVSTVGAAIAYAYTSAAAWRLAGGDRRARATGLCGLVLSAAVLVLFIVPNYASGAMMATESYLILVLWCVLGFLFFLSVFRRDRQNRFGRSTVVWLAMLVIIAAMSLMWMRQAGNETTEKTFQEVVRFHDTLLPHADETEENHWKVYLAALRDDMDAELLHNGLVQTGLMILAFAILFNLNAILRRRERALERETALRERERDEEREKSKARSYFFSTVSHDIRTPLNAIIGFSEMLKMGFDTEEERQQAIDSILVGGRTLLSLVNDLLDLSKLESGKMAISPEPVDVKPLLHGVLEAFRVSANKPELELRLAAEDMPALMLDPQRVRQIVFNLVGNAVKFTEKGFVELRASFRPEAGEQTGTFRLEVEDTGCGISDEDLKRIATAWVQVGSKASRHGGTGLGLAICKQLAAAMGGSFGAASKLGKGTTFSIEIPRVATAPAGAAATPPPLPAPTAPTAPAAAAAPAAPRRILVVDDSGVNRMVLKTLLKKEGGYDVALAGDGLEALDALRAAPADRPFDLVITDLRMPNLDGQGLVKAIRADPALRGLRVVVATADMELRDQAASMGFDGGILKPITLASLAEVLSAPASAGERSSR